MNQNHDTPRIALRTAGCFLARRNTATDSGIGFQLIFRSGAPASARGMARLTRLPVIASATTAAAATTGPLSPASLKISPPKIMPTRIEIDVPISTRPLPPVSSSGFSTAGRIEYFTGPNSVDCTPVAEQRDQQHDHVLGQEADRRQRHDHDLHRRGDADQLRLLEFLGDLSGGRREQEVRQDEQRRCEIGVERALLGADAEVEQQADDRLPIDVVVERAERLGGEERQETALLQQLELVVGHASPGVCAGD